MPRTSKIDWEAVQSDYARGRTYAWLADKYGCTPQGIYKAFRRLGIQLRGHRRGAEHQNWKGGRRQNGQGYIRVWVDPVDPMAVMVPPSEKSSHVLEHRLVMARHIGRPLRADETIHHINGDKTDNRIENLQLHVGKHGNGIVYCCSDCGSFNVTPKEIA